MTIIIVAFVAAMVLAQRQRTRLRQEQALLVARAHEEERGWVASELHDDVLQRVALVRAEVESIWTSPEPQSAARLENHLRAINAELVDLAVAVRRIATRLHPTIVDQVGLPSALESLVAEVERGSDLAVEVTTEGASEPMSQETARAVYRIVQEALRNAARHAAARRARVRLTFGVRDLDLSISDDGRGFDPLATPSQGIGLASMRERALIAGGTATVRSRPGAGTTIDVRLPMGRS